ncbi:MAG: acetyl-CoA carboxylase carboxyltransferase subunit alpha [Chloroflexi bacterium]|nr:acetyl-CoA carboxylase carboxyltransferase subunit alpha [Chloroflexota bacterium]
MTPSPEPSAADAWERVHLARQPCRPHLLDYLRAWCPTHVELHGDRAFGDDPALIGALARLDGQTVLVLGHQKGNDTRENLRRNFAMPKPEGYRKAARLMRHAEKFGFPVVSLIDTPGAEPGLHSEERGQATAIAEAIQTMVQLRVPTVAVVIGEGGSGGALAIGVADRVLMLENAIYAVASPEAAAAILWNDAAQAPAAAAMMRITAPELATFGIVDGVVPEPLGGAHLDPATTIATLRAAVGEALGALRAEQAAGVDGLLRRRFARYRRLGVWQERQAAALEPALAGRQ